MEFASLLGMLGVLSVEDVRKKEIHRDVMILFGIAGVVFHLAFQRISIGDLFGGLLVGCGMLVISYFSGGRVGIGDGVLFVVTGIFLGFRGNLVLLWCALMLMGVYALVLCLTGHLGKREKIPFVPFVLLGYVLMIACEGGAIHA